LKRLELRAGKLAHAVPRGTWPSNGRRLPDETLYHFHEPQGETEANAWLINFLTRYNSMQHREEPHEVDVAGDGLLPKWGGRAGATLS
jgi:hypothetical protein